MRKLTEMVRLAGMGLGMRAIARSVGVARSTVSGHLGKLHAAGVAWPLPADMTEEALEQIVFSVQPQFRSRDDARPVPDWAQVRNEKGQKGLTLRLLWIEYRREHAAGYGYSQYCEHYRRWLGTQEVCLRQSHPPGERLFVDFAGMTMPVTCRQTGAVEQMQIFVAALGASHYLYAEAFRSQQLPDWIDAHVHAFEQFGGVPALIVPDNLRSAISRACRYDPDINPTYRDMAEHYDTAIMPARPRKPRDKAKVETGVQIIEREVLAPLRSVTFFSLGELNEAIAARVKAVNERPFQKQATTRKALFEELDRPALKPLPERRYEFADFRQVRPNIDYHIVVHGHYYSVPFELRNTTLDLRITRNMVEVFHRGRRVALHTRNHRQGHHSTQPEHMPKAHRAYLEWTPSRVVNWAGKIGSHCAALVEHILRTRPHPEQGYRAALGIIRLAKGYTNERVDAACQRALVLDVCTYGSVRSILRMGKDREPLGSPPARLAIGPHDNIRGAGYYAGEGQVAHAG